MQCSVEMTSARPNELTVPVQGMTCAHCVTADERAIGVLPGVVDVKASCAHGRVQGMTVEDPDRAMIEAALKREGYTLDLRASSPGRRAAEAAAAFMAVFAAILLAGQFTARVGVADEMSLGMVFVSGLAASVSSCMAITGGLLVALVSKHSQRTRNLSRRERFLPLAYFNARLLSYPPFLGGAIGCAGSAFNLPPLATGVMKVAISAVMIFIGLHSIQTPSGHNFRGPS
jgi:uncharacterized protein